MRTLTLIIFFCIGIYSAYAQTTNSKKTKTDHHNTTSVHSNNSDNSNNNSGVPLNTITPENNTIAPSGNNPNYYQPPMPTTDQPINEPQNTPTHPTESVEPVYPENAVPSK